MKKIYILLLLFIAAVPTMAQQMLIKKGDNIGTIELNKFNKITFNGTTVKIEQTNGENSEAKMSNIEWIRFSNYTDIKDITANTQSLISYISSDEIAINCNAGDFIRIYDIIGSQMICVRQKADNGTLSIAQLPKGIYIINVNDRTAKFVKR